MRQLCRNLKALTKQSPRVKQANKINPSKWLHINQSKKLDASDKDYVPGIRLKIIIVNLFFIDLKSMNHYSKNRIYRIIPDLFR